MVPIYRGVVADKNQRGIHRDTALLSVGEYIDFSMAAN